MATAVMAPEVASPSDPFVYVAPNAVTGPWYAELSVEERRVRSALAGVGGPAVDFELINKICKVFYDTVDKLCPASADKSAALRCVRLARMTANEMAKFGRTQALERDLDTLLRHARFQASASIAMAQAGGDPAFQVAAEKKPAEKKK